MNGKLEVIVEDQKPVAHAMKLFEKNGSASIIASKNVIETNKVSAFQKAPFSKSKFNDFLKITVICKLKEVSRSSTNSYHCDKENIDIIRRETTAEHGWSCGKVARYF